MKKTLSIFLALSFIFNAAGYLLIFLILQSSLKENAKEKISTGNLIYSDTLFVFAKNDLQNGIAGLKFIDEKEFSLMGKMYDIIKKENNNDSLYFYCLADADEDDLNLAFNKRTNSEKRDKNSENQRLLKNILQDGLLCEGLFNPLTISKINFYIDKSSFHTFNDFEILTPPPISIPV